MCGCLSNGNILFTRMKYIAEEVTPDKKVLWRYDFKTPKGPASITRKSIPVSPLD